MSYLNCYPPPRGGGGFVPRVSFFVDTKALKLFKFYSHILNNMDMCMLLNLKMLVVYICTYLSSFLWQMSLQWLFFLSGKYLSVCVKSSQSSHHPQEVLLAQFSLYVHKGGLKPDSFHLSVSKSKMAVTGQLLNFPGKNPNTIIGMKWLQFHIPSYKDMCKWFFLNQHFLNQHSKNGRHGSTSKFLVDAKTPIINNIEMENYLFLKIYQK